VVIYLCAFSLLFKGTILKAMNKKPKAPVKADDGKEGKA